MTSLNQATNLIVSNIDKYLLGGVSPFIGNRKYEFFNGWVEGGFYHLYDEHGKSLISHHEMKTFVLILKLDRIYTPGKDFSVKLKEYLDTMKTFNLPLN